MIRSEIAAAHSRKASEPRNDRRKISRLEAAPTKSRQILRPPLML